MIIKPQRRILKIAKPREKRKVVNSEEKIKELEDLREKTQMEANRLARKRNHEIYTHSMKQAEITNKEYSIVRKSLVNTSKNLFKFKLKQQENSFKIYDVKFKLNGRLTDLFYDIGYIHGLDMVDRIKVNRLLLKKLKNTKPEKEADFIIKHLTGIIYKYKKGTL